MDTYFWIKLVDAADGLFYIAALNGIANRHAILNAVQVDLRAEACLVGEALGGIFVAFDHKIIHDEPVQVPREAL